jgi:hypothetical protein
VNWRIYSNFIDEKVKDAKHNLDYAEKKYKEAQVVYTSVLREKENFENALEELIKEVGKDEI